jgi:heat shock protein HslJ
MRIFLVGAIAVLSGCGSKPPNSDGSPPVGSVGAPPESASGSQSMLLNTNWRITILDSTRVPADTGRREARLLLQEDASKIRYSATVGCNGISGEATVEGDRITFGPGMSTKMFCEALNALEVQLHTILTRTRRWSIAGDTLELRDDAATRLARLEKSTPR